MREELNAHEKTDARPTRASVFYIGKGRMIGLTMCAAGASAAMQSLPGNKLEPV